ncbi:MAG: NAD(P)H-quinone oxidoreductase subunit N [Cyanobacteriota bacterium ELA615]|jgi:NAD(P)H-quinone oxidoreductase subunit N
MAILTTGKDFIRSLEQTGACGVYAPLEGGYEGRYQRRLRTIGYTVFNITARGLGDVSSYLMGNHGIRPPHLGKKNIGQEAMVGHVQFIPPIAGYHLENLPAKSKGLVLWIIEGHILSREEIFYLANLPKTQPRIKIVLELGGERYFRYQSLQDFLLAA